MTATTPIIIYRIFKRTCTQSCGMAFFETKLKLISISVTD